MKDFLKLDTDKKTIIKGLLEELEKQIYNVQVCVKTLKQVIEEL